jgi:hypothetical protein
LVKASASAGALTHALATPPETRRHVPQWQIMLLSGAAEMA